MPGQHIVLTRLLLFSADTAAASFVPWKVFVCHLSLRDCQPCRGRAEVAIRTVRIGSSPLGTMGEVLT